MRKHYEVKFLMDYRDAFSAVLQAHLNDEWYCFGSPFATEWETSYEGTKKWVSMLGVTIMRMSDVTLEQELKSLNPARPSTGMERAPVREVVIHPSPVDSA